MPSEYSTYIEGSRISDQGDHEYKSTWDLTNLEPNTTYYYTGEEYDWFENPHEEYQDDVRYFTTGDHDWDEGVSQADGSVLYTCTYSGCGETKVETSPHKHTPGTPEKVEHIDNCEEGGYEETITRCTECNEIIHRTAVSILPSDHHWDEGKVTLKPTPTTLGEFTYTCQRCRATEVIDDEPYYSVYSVSLDKSELTLDTSSGYNEEASTYQLTAKVSPSYATNPEATWTSSNENVASVDENGLVTAKTYGEAVITASTLDGVSASCTVKTDFYDAAVGVSDTQGNIITSGIADSIHWMADSGITKGYDGVYFGSFRDTSRKDFVIFLWRQAGRPEVSGGKSFSDTTKYKAGTDTYKAIRWATSKGIINGYSDGTFRPDDSVTRAQVATMLWKYAGRPNAEARSSFPDVEVNKDGLTANMVRAINWCSNKGIVKGYSNGPNNGKFVPSGACLRFQMSVILYRYNNNK